MFVLKAPRKSIIKIIALIFFGAALYHLTALFFHLNDLPVWRQVLFVCVDIFFGIAVKYPPKYFLNLFVILLIEQIYSHGSRLINVWAERKGIDWLSVLVLLYLPVVFFFLFFDEMFNSSGNNKF